jgi:hypothetical protein
MGNSVTKCCKIDIEAVPEKGEKGTGSFESYNTKDYGTLFDEIIKEKDEYNK